MAEDELIKKHTKAAYDAWKDPHAGWRHKVKEVLLEVMIIVFAVSLSIWLHSWSESLKDRKEEKEFLTALKGDLQTDIKEMNSDRESLERNLAAVYYFEKVGRGEALNADSMNSNSWIFFSNTSISPSIGRYEALKGSGRLDIVENKELLKNIADLYQKFFTNIAASNQSSLTLKSVRMTPVIDDNLQLDSDGKIVNWQQILRVPKMRMLVMQDAGVAQVSIARYTEGIDKATEIIGQIDKALQ
jgi:hypothetical protein